MFITVRQKYVKFFYYSLKSVRLTNELETLYTDTVQQRRTTTPA